MSWNSDKRWHPDWCDLPVLVFVELGQQSLLHGLLFQLLLLLRGSITDVDPAGRAQGGLDQGQRAKCAQTFTGPNKIIKQLFEELKILLYVRYWNKD